MASVRECSVSCGLTHWAAEQGIGEGEALEKGLKEKSAEFIEKGAEVYAKT